MTHVVVLLGAPGSGKSTVGAGLEAFGFRWVEWEPFILERWGSRDDFIARKDEALPELHREIRSWIASDGRPAVIETTGLSDEPLIADLAASGQTFVVRLDVGDHEAMVRIRRREGGRHLTDDAALNRRVWGAFQERVVPRYDSVSTSRSTPSRRPLSP